MPLQALSLPIKGFSQFSTVKQSYSTRCPITPRFWRLRHLGHSIIPANIIPHNPTKPPLLPPKTAYLRLTPAIPTQRPFMTYRFSFNKQVGKFMEYPVTVENGMNAVLYHGLQSDQIAAKSHLLALIAYLRRSTPELRPVGLFKRQQGHQVGIFFVGFHPAAGLTHLFELVTVRQVRLKAGLTKQIA